jgi:hypothetical protein
LWSLGYPDQAVVAAKEAVLLARACGHVPLTASRLFVGAFLGTALGAGGELAALAEDAEAYCIEHSVIAYREWSRFCRGIMLAADGDANKGSPSCGRRWPRPGIFKRGFCGRHTLVI